MPEVEGGDAMPYNGSADMFAAAAARAEDCRGWISAGGVTSLGGSLLLKSERYRLVL